MKSNNLLLLPLLSCCLLSPSLVEKVEGGKILNIAFMSTKSHKITYEPLLRELAKKGHEITIVNPNPGKDEKNIRYIQTINPEDLWKTMPNMFEMKLNMPSILKVIQNPYIFMGKHAKHICSESFKLPQVRQLLNEKFDLVFFPALFNECLYGLIHKLNTSVVLYNQAGVIPWMADTFGAPSPPSFVSAAMLANPDQMGFFTRIWNLVNNIIDWSVLQLYYYPMVQNLYREALNDPTIPSVKEIESNASIILANSQISFNQPRPLMPDIIEVGGMHLVPAKPVQPKELDDFLTGAKDGFILFSMGSALKGSMMPENYRKLFLNVFSKLKQRVIWKWETEQMDGLPPNVKLSKWLPQQDVLGHKNIRAFITHGGHGSTTEAIYHGVPLIGIPMLGDQPSNLRKAHRLGFAVPPLDFAGLTQESLLEAINLALNEPSYRETAKKLSGIYLDQITKPLERGVYWVEYVLRHQGAVHLRSASRDLNFIQYFSLDVIAALALIALNITIINFLVLRALYRKCFGSKVTSAKALSAKKKKQ